MSKSSKTFQKTGSVIVLKVLEFKNAIFSDLESFVNERIFEIAMEKFWILFGKTLIMS